MPVEEITSDTVIPIEQHFRIAAGPGAGKTHWLVIHIQSVLQLSSRLDCSKKIACITYTNIGVETIVKRFDFVADRVEVSSIHSFIYNNIIKPYVAFIAAEYELDVAKMDGHDDHIVSRSRIVEWLISHPNAGSFSHPYTLNQLTKLDNNIEGLGNWLNSLHYTFSGSQLVVAVKNAEAYYLDGQQRRMLSKTNCLDKLLPGLMAYKRLFWRKGILHHDDVLYFGYLLLTRFPFILAVLRAKFPYFFVDEFQDTSPIQAKILALVGEATTVIGVIGDQAQSIYSFQGAEPEHFRSFSLPGLQDYVISGNRRSTDAIVGLLNHMRRDIRQHGLRNVEGERPTLLVGTMEQTLAIAMELSAGSPLTILSRDNITANAMKRQFNSALPTRDLLVELFGKDSNFERRAVIVHCIDAVELARQRRFKEAIKEMERNFYSVRNKEDRKKTAFRQLCFLLANYEEYKIKPLYDFFLLVRSTIRKDIANLINKGEALPFYRGHTYEQMAVCVRIAEDNSPSRTIHKSKGDEFENVLVLLKGSDQLNVVLRPDLSKEEHRVYYVAVSRGRQRLFLSVPALSTAEEAMAGTLLNIFRVKREAQDVVRSAHNDPPDLSRNNGEGTVFSQTKI